MNQQTNKRLKIAVLVLRFDSTKGGAERYCVELTRRIACQHDVHVYAQEVGNEYPEIKYHILPRKIKRLGFINQLIFSRQTRKLTSNENFDIIHGHERVSHASVHTIHVNCVKTKLSSAKGWRKIKQYIKIFTSLRLMSYLWIESKQFSINKPKKHMAVSHFQEKNIILNYPHAQIHHDIPYPGTYNLSLKHHSIKKANIRQKYDIPTDAFVFLFVANDIIKKGLPTILEAMEQLLTNNIDHDINLMHLLIVGNVTEKDLIIPKQIKKHIHIHGHEKDIDYVYQQCNSLIHPTTVDSYGMVVLEAMSHNKPVIVSSRQYCGVSEQLTNDEACVLSDPENATELSQAILKIITDKSYRQKISQLGYQKSLSMTWEKTSQIQMQAYRELLG